MTFTKKNKILAKRVGSWASPLLLAGLRAGRSSSTPTPLGKQHGPSRGRGPGALPGQRRLCLPSLSLQPRTAIHQGLHNCCFLFILHGCLTLTTFVGFEIYFGVPVQAHSTLQLCHSEQQRQRVGSLPPAAPNAAGLSALLRIRSAAAKGPSAFWGCLRTSGKQLRQPTIKKTHVYVCPKHGHDEAQTLAREAADTHPRERTDRSLHKSR